MSNCPARALMVHAIEQLDAGKGLGAEEYARLGLQAIKAKNEHPPIPVKKEEAAKAPPPKPQRSYLPYVLGTIIVLIAIFSYQMKQDIGDDSRQDKADIPAPLVHR